MKLIDKEVTNPGQYAGADMKTVIVVWSELPETVSIYYGLVNPHQLEALHICHGHYIHREDEPTGMINWFYNEDGELLLHKSWNLSLQNTPIAVECAIVFEMGSLL